MGKEKTSNCLEQIHLIQYKTFETRPGGEPGTLGLEVPGAESELGTGGGAAEPSLTGGQ